MMFWTTFAAAIPDTPRYDIKPNSAYWPERGQRKPYPAPASTPRDTPPKPAKWKDPMEDMRPLDYALMKVLQLYPDAYHAVIAEMRRIFEAGGP